jgi:hypothetical protein
MKATENKLIKAFENPRYRVELHEVNHKYIIAYESSKYHAINYSEAISDYNMASYLFELKLTELEGQ